MRCQSVDRCNVDSAPNISHEDSVTPNRMSPMVHLCTTRNWRVRVRLEHVESQQWWLCILFGLAFLFNPFYRFGHQVKRVSQAQSPPPSLSVPHKKVKLQTHCLLRFLSFLYLKYTLSHFLCLISYIVWWDCLCFFCQDSLALLHQRARKTKH